MATGRVTCKNNAGLDVQVATVFHLHVHPLSVCHVFHIYQAHSVCRATACHAAIIAIPQSAQIECHSSEGSVELYIVKRSCPGVYKYTVQDIHEVHDSYIQQT